MTFIVEIRRNPFGPWCRCYASRKQVDAMRVFVLRSERCEEVRLVTGRGSVVARSEG